MLAPDIVLWLPGYYSTDSGGLPQSSTVSSQSSATLMAASNDMPADSTGACPGIPSPTFFLCGPNFSLLFYSVSCSGSGLMEVKAKPSSWVGIVAGLSRQRV